MMKLFSLTVALAASLLAGKAQAAVMQAVFTGVVSEGAVSWGAFGLPDGTILDGMAFTQTVIYDTALGYTNVGSSESHQTAGSGTPGFVLSSRLTIAGGARSFVHGPTDFHEDFIRSSSPTQSYGQYSAYSANLWFVEITVIAAPGVIPLDPDTPFTANSVIPYEGFIAIQEMDTSVYAYLYASKLVVTNLSLPTVPLPASGVLLLAGLGGIAALRRRKAG
jgi:hypothetical protein